MSRPDHPKTNVSEVQGHFATEPYKAYCIIFSIQQVGLGGIVTLKPSLEQFQIEVPLICKVDWVHSDRSSSKESKKWIGGSNAVAPLRSNSGCQNRSEDILMKNCVLSVKGRVKPGHWGGAKLDQLVAWKLFDLQGRRAS